LLSCNSRERFLLPLLTRFRDIHFKPYTEEEFVEIVINVLDREEGVDRNIALLTYASSEKPFVMFLLLILEHSENQDLLI
jgi:hypothetical protein